MIITRKIKVFVAEEDPSLKKDYIHTIYMWRDEVRKAANMIVAHKFVQHQMAAFATIDDELREKFVGTKKFVFPKDILKKEKGNSEQNSTYRIVSSQLKGKVPSGIYCSLNQAVSNSFKETYVEFLKGNASIRSYRNNIPMPFPAKAIANLHEDDNDHRYYFTLFSIPFAFYFGKDRSGNRAIIDRCLDGTYKMCSSSLAIIEHDDATGKKKVRDFFMYICVDIPKKVVKLKEGKKLYAFLDVEIPILCTLKKKAEQDFDSVVSKEWFKIGSKEEFNHRRIQIQAALRRCQINAKYAVGGHGRKKKTKSIDRFHLKEENYIETRLHMYSKDLVSIAVKNSCSEIVLLDQKKREDKAINDNKHGEPYVLRNWSYGSLKQKITYKAAMYGIVVNSK